MSGYPHNPPGYGGGPPAQPYAASHQQGAAPSPYGQPPPHNPDKPPKDSHGYGYGAAPSPYGQPPPHNPDKPPKDSHGYGYGAAPSPYGQPPPHNPDKPPKDSYGYGYGAASHQQGAAPSPYGQPPSHNPDKPPKDSYGHGYGGGQPHYGGSAPPTNQQYGSAAPPSYGNPFAVLVPSAFPPGTDPSVVACFQVADQDGSGLIDDKELQRALSSYNQSFSLRTVHLLMYHFTNTNSRKIGPKEFTALFYGLQNWRSIFERFDRDRSGKIDAPELREALLNLGYAVSPLALDLLVLKFDKTGGKSKAIEYDNFIECCLVVKGLTDKFKAKDTKYSGSATFSYEEFMVTVLPFLVA